MRQLTTSRGLLLLLALATPATAAERRIYVSSFERLRVEGPFAVTLATGRSPGGAVVGDARAIEGVEARQQGDTLVIRPSPTSEQVFARRGTPDPVTITLATPRLTSATLIGGGALAVAGAVRGGRTQRLDLAVTGAGSIALTGADAEAASATVIGGGAITVSGRVGRARLVVSGAGKIGADQLDAGDLTVRVDGPGEVAARARYTATASNAGLGKVVVAGKPKCVVNSAGGGPVTCGAAH